MPHSEAKIRLYGDYLSVYLNILHRTSFVKTIFLFDLFCGEGLYQNDAKGSPIIALECIKNHFFTNKRNVTDMTVWFNDNGRSEIDPSVDKVDRVQSKCDEIFRPPNVKVEYYKENYDAVRDRAVDLVSRTDDSRGLFFLDPYGYKDISLNDIRKMLAGGKTEVLLWLPIAQMYRFYGPAQRAVFPSSMHLRDFLSDLFGQRPLEFGSIYEFIHELKTRFRDSLGGLNMLVDTFTFQRDPTNVYSLFFFTPNVRGFEKMLEVKWREDPTGGKGHSAQQHEALFTPMELAGYDQELLAYLRGAPHRTNCDLYQFGLEHGFLPKHTKAVLDRLGALSTRIEVFPLDGKPIHGYYIKYRAERLVGIRIVEDAEN